MSDSLPRKVDRSAPGKVEGKLRVALESMIWQGTNYMIAAKAAGLTTRAMRYALSKPHVSAYLAAGKKVLRSSEGPKTIRRLAELRDQDVNRNAAVAAAKALEQIPDDHPHAGAPAAARAGLVIVIQGGGKPTRTIEHNAAESAGELVADPPGNAALLIDQRPRGR